MVVEVGTVVSMANAIVLGVLYLLQCMLGGREGCACGSGGGGNVWVYVVVMLVVFI